MVFARLQALAALGTLCEFCAVPAFFPGTPDVGRCSEVHFQPPQLCEASVAARERAVETLRVLLLVLLLELHSAG
jgi:hypothetical protein